MEKIFIKAEDVRNDSFKLTKQLIETGFVPTIIYAPMRGGSNVANPMGEYFKYLGIKVKYGTVIASSYNNVYERNKVVNIEGWAPPLSSIKPNEKIVIAEDMFDTGNTISAIVNRILSKTKVKREQIKIVVRDYKIYTYNQDEPKIKPDFYAVKHIIKSPDKKVWTHYNSHELVGLNKEKIVKHYGLDVAKLIQLDIQKIKKSCDKKTYKKIKSRLLESGFDI